MIREDGRASSRRPLTIATVAALGTAGRRLVAAADRVVDLSAAGPVDSAALALLLSWTRKTSARRRAAVPPSSRPPPLVSLASSTTSIPLPCRWA